METAPITQDHTTEQFSVLKIILLSLLLGAMVVIFDLLAAPVVESLELPPLFTLFLGNALFIALFAQIADAEVDALTTAPDQTARDTVEHVLLPFKLVSVRPDIALLP